MWRWLDGVSGWIEAPPRFVIGRYLTNPMVHINKVVLWRSTVTSWHLITYCSLFSAGTCGDLSRFEVACEVHRLPAIVLAYKSRSDWFTEAPLEDASTWKAYTQQCMGGTIWCRTGGELSNMVSSSSRCYAIRVRISGNMLLILGRISRSEICYTQSFVSREGSRWLIILPQFGQTVLRTTFSWLPRPGE